MKKNAPALPLTPKKRAITSLPILAAIAAVFSLPAAQAGTVIVPGSGTANGGAAVVVSGLNNNATGFASGIFTGFNHNATGAGVASTILTGIGNTMHARNSYIGCGNGHTINGTGASAIISGTGNSISVSGDSCAVVTGTGNSLNGVNSVIVGGSNFSTDTSSHSLFFGSDINFSFGGADGVVYLADNSREGVAETEFFPTDNRMYCRFANGFHFFTDDNADTGARLVGGATAWAVLSARHTKRDFEKVDTVDALERLCALPMTRWTYKHDDNRTPYMGVMAEDLYEAFHLGHDNKTINTLVADGVQVAAIQGLNKKLENELAEKNERIDELEHSQEKLEARLAKLEKLLEKAAE